MPYLNGKLLFLLCGNEWSELAFFDSHSETALTIQWYKTQNHYRLYSRLLGWVYAVT